MSKHGATSHSVFQKLVTSVLVKLDSTVGIINASFGAFILIVFLTALSVPVAQYILKGVLIICNTILLMSSKSVLDIEVSEPSFTLVIVCACFLLVEMVICCFWVNDSENKKRKLEQLSNT